MKSVIPIVAICLALLVSSATAGKKSQIVDQKKELEQIKKDVEDSRNRLDSLRAVEESVAKQIADYDQRISSDRKLITRLSSELSGLKKSISEAELSHQAYQTQFDQTRRRYLGNVRQTYYATRAPDNILENEPNGELNLHRTAVYLTALAGFESGNVVEAQVYLDRSIDQLDDLTGQRKLVNNLKKEKEISYSLGQSKKEKQERSLDRLKRLKQDEADRMLTLQQAAAEMQEIIARLEEANRRNQYPETDVAPSVFTSLKGQMIMPYRGKVVTPFGLSVDPITKLKSYSPGIVIKGTPGATVRLVASGTVAYSGNLRGYGKFVIIRHDSQHYTTYAGLGRIDVSEGLYLGAGSALGTSADDGLVRFELREEREPLDPVEWIKFEAL
ncbi:peptidoglycan DD-metalloendopeptidase family protein [bacterium]|nr:peptidoglycan DD-metalloendopeptidase family protein [bacterium]